MFGLGSWQHAAPYLGLALLGGYLLGSIPFGLLLTKLGGTADLRSIGSGNIGATNVLRTGRKDLAALTLLFDALKGTAAVWLGNRYGPYAAMAAGLGAFLGHLLPVWLKFKGGKGVATFLGVLLGLWWPAFLAVGAVWLAVAALWRMSSLASLTSSAAALLIFWAGGWPEEAVVIALMTALLWWKHEQNIARLRAGTEPGIGQK